MRRSHVRLMVFLLGLVMILVPLLASCGGEEEPTPTTAPTATPTTVPPTPTQPQATPTTVPEITPTPTTVVAGPPNIPHTLEGRDNCLMCHQIGAPGVGEPGGMGLPAGHEGRTIEICQGCHQPAS